MASGAGDAVAHRRRDLRTWFLLSSSLLFSFFSFNLPKNPNLSSSSVFFFSDSLFCNGKREQCFITFLNQTSPTKLSWNRATEVLHHLNDIFGQISEQFFDDTSNDSRSGPTMGVTTFPLPPTSTLTPTNHSPARCSMPSTMTPADPPCLTRPSTRTPASTPQFILPSTVIPMWTPLFDVARFNHARRSVFFSGSLQRSVDQTFATSLFSASEPSGSVPTPFPFPPATTASIPIINSSLYCCRAAILICPSKVSLGFPLLGLSFHFGPLSKSRPITKKTGPFSVNDWPRYVLLSPSQLQLNFSVLSGRRHHLSLKSTTVQWSCGYHPSILSQISSMAKFVETKILQEARPAEEDWKKSQVDSKKILAQPHQSFKSMSFCFFPRSKISSVDDLAKKAVRSMTTGLSMFFL